MRKRLREEEEEYNGERGIEVMKLVIWCAKMDVNDICSIFGNVCRQLNLYIRGLVAFCIIDGFIIGSHGNHAYSVSIKFPSTNYLHHLGVFKTDWIVPNNDFLKFGNMYVDTICIRDKKHNIITRTAATWYGGYRRIIFNSNDNKITCLKNTETIKYTTITYEIHIACNPNFLETK
jgi:hypothetical protein